MAELQIVWLYRARPDKVADFERVYGADGAWARLFRQGAGFLGSDLYRNAEEPARYLVADRWRSVGAHEAFMERFHAEYAALAAKTADLYMAEERIGSFARL